MVVDTSALVSIIEREPGWEAHLRSIEEAPERWISPVTYAELGMVLAGRSAVQDRARLEQWLARLRVEVDEETPLQAAAFEAYLRYGKARHPARLNLGDCFSYALAKTLGTTLLFKGDDFAKTDIRPAL